MQRCVIRDKKEVADDDLSEKLWANTDSDKVIEMRRKRAEIRNINTNEFVRLLRLQQQQKIDRASLIRYVIHSPFWVKCVV